MTFVTVELTKFTKQMNDIESDLDKLIYTMKNLHTISEASQFPKFWNEEWLKKAISEVDLRNMTAEQKLSYEMAISTNALALKNENLKIKDAENKKENVVKTDAVLKALLRSKLSIEEIAEDNSVNIDFVLNLQKQLPAS